MERSSTGSSSQPSQNLATISLPTRPPLALGCSVSCWIQDEPRTKRAWARFSGGSLVCKMFIREHLCDQLTLCARMGRGRSWAWRKPQPILWEALQPKLPVIGHLEFTGQSLYTPPQAVTEYKMAWEECILGQDSSVPLRPSVRRVDGWKPSAHSTPHNWAKVLPWRKNWVVHFLGVYHTSDQL